MEPRPDDELLLPARVRPRLMLPPDEAHHGALAHEVIPAPDGEGGHVHLREVQRAILVAPVAVVVRVREPLFEQRVVVRRHASDLAHRLEALGPRHATDAVALLIKAQTRVRHVLRDKVRRLGDGEEVLRIPGLRPAIGADLARAPRLRRKPLAEVEPILLFAPGQRTVATPLALGESGAPVVHQCDDKATFSKLRRRLARASAPDVCITLLEDGGPRPLAERMI